MVFLISFIFSSSDDNYTMQLVNSSPKHPQTHKTACVCSCKVRLAIQGASHLTEEGKWWEGAIVGYVPSWFSGRLCCVWG